MVSSDPDSGYETGPDLPEKPTFLPTISPSIVEEALSSPQTIILSLWPHAQPEQTRYYIQGYSTLYPHSRILLLHHTRSPSALSQQIDSILTTLLGPNSVTPLARPQSEVLVHTFDNTSTANLLCFLKSYQSRTSQVLGIRSLVLDSVPITLVPNLRSIWFNPSLLFGILLAPWLHIWATLILWFSEPLSEDVRTGLEESCPRITTRRTWVFPGKDVMFARSLVIRDDEESAGRIGSEKGLVTTQRSVRWSAGQERYWARIERAWEGR